VPFPPLNTGVVLGGEWSELPGMVGTELRWKIHQAADVLVNERRMKVFQYWAGPEDGICRWKSNFDFDFSVVNKIVTVACYGEVWTDENANILRMSSARMSLLGSSPRLFHAGTLQQEALRVSRALY
jgi:hypothetical protein